MDYIGGLPLSSQRRGGVVNKSVYKLIGGRSTRVRRRRWWPVKQGLHIIIEKSEVSCHVMLNFSLNFKHADSYQNVAMLIFCL